MASHDRSEQMSAGESQTALVGGALLAAAGLSATHAPSKELGDRLLAALAQSAETWPGLAVSPLDFAEHVGSHLPDVEELGAELDSMRLPDLALALGCAQGTQKALAHFELAILHHAPKAVRRVDADKSFVAQVVDETRVRLLVGDGRPPRILGYAGRGPLESWVMVSAVRIAYSIKRKEKKSSVPADGLELMIEGDAEFEQIRQQIAEPFRKAFRTALRALSSRERTVLRLYFVEDVSSDAIGSMYNVHRSTVARWITTARDAAQKETRRILMDELKIGRSTFDSLMRNLLSHFDLPFITALSNDSAHSNDAGAGE